MKHWAIGLLGLAAVVVGAAVFRQGASSRVTGNTDPANEADLSDTLDVDPFMQNVDRYQRPVRVAGVVNTASATDQMLTLIDRREFQECGVTTCATLYLPVRWTGAMPESGQAVQVEGQVRKEGGRLVFVARKLERLDQQ